MVQLTGGRASALAMLIERLRWPTKMVRWQAARGLRSLLSDSSTRAFAEDALLEWMSRRTFESEVLSALSVFAASPFESRPDFERLTAAVSRPSMGADFLINEMYGKRTDAWRSAHSGSAPEGFTAESYFSEHQRAQVPGGLSMELEYLEQQTTLPFMRQWGFEWTQLRSQLRTRYTLYPYYFGDIGLQREGVIGQFIQRQGELYRSAFQRTLACAVSEWSVPLRTVAPFSSYGVPALPGVFDLEPGRRPEWLPAIGAQLAPDADLSALAKALLDGAPADDFTIAQLRIPTDRSLDEFGELEMSAFFVTDDFALSPNQSLEGRWHFVQLDRYRFDSSREPLEKRIQAGQQGTALAVCCNEQPSIHGYWHDEYYQRGLALPAPYCFDRNTYQRVSKSGLTVSIGGLAVGSVEFWLDAWTPLYAPNSATRIGSVSRIRKKDLQAAATRLGMKLGYFVRLSRMMKPQGKYDREPLDRTAFFRLTV